MKPAHEEITARHIRAMRQELESIKVHTSGILLVVDTGPGKDGIVSANFAKDDSTKQVLATVNRMYAIAGRSLNSLIAEVKRQS